MATRPNSLGRGIEKVGDIILQTALQRRQLAQRDRQLDLDERRIDVNEQAQAFDRIMSIAPLLPTGSAISDHPILHRQARIAFGDLTDEEFNDLSQIVVTPETFQTIVNDRVTQYARDLPDDSPIMERIRNRALLGTSASGTQLEAGDVQAQAQMTQAQAVMEGLRAVNNDPELLMDYGRTLLGSEPLVEIPGVVDQNGNPITFDSEGIANIWTRLQMQRDEFSFRTNLASLDEDAKTDMAGELMDQMEAHDITIGRPAAQNIINAYVDSVEGDFEEGESPIEELMAQDSPIGTAAKAFVQGINVMDESYINSLPPGARNFLFAGEALSDILPKEDIPRALEALSPAIGGVDVDASGFFGIRGPRFRVDLRTGNEPQESDATSVDSGTFSLPTDLSVDERTIIDAILRGEATVEQAQQRFGDDVVQRVVPLIEKAREAGLTALTGGGQ